MVAGSAEKTGNVLKKTALISEAYETPQKNSDLTVCDYSEAVLSPESAGPALMSDPYAFFSCPDMLSAELTLSSKLDSMHQNKM